MKALILPFGIALIAGVSAASATSVIRAKSSVVAKAPGDTVKKAAALDTTTERVIDAASVSHARNASQTADTMAAKATAHDTLPATKPDPSHAPKAATTSTP